MGLCGVAVSAVGERAGVAGVVQHAQHGVVGQRFPVQLALARSFAVSPGEGQGRGVERFDACGGRAGRFEGGEQVCQGVADRGVGVEDDVPGGVVDQPDRQWCDQFTAAGLGGHPAAQPGLDEMQLSLLCGLARYADIGAGVGGGERSRLWVLGIINHRCSRNARTLSGGW